MTNRTLEPFEDHEGDVAPESAAQEIEASSPPERDGIDQARTLINAAATRSAVRGAKRATHARKVSDTLVDISSRVPEQAAARSQWLELEASRTISSVGPVGKTGARGRLKGHLFEDLDIAAYNKSGKAVGKSMAKRLDARNAAYDASKFQGGKFRGAVQHKTSPAGVEAAIKKMEKIKPGSATRGTIRVPGDRAIETAKRTGQRTRVQGSKVTSRELENTLDSGLAELATKGSKGTSARRALAKGTAKSAMISAAVGAVCDVPALAAGDLTGRDFSENRLVDASEAVAVTTAGSLAAGALLGTTAGTAAATAVGGAVASSAATGAAAVAGMGSMGGAAATALGGVTAAAAGPVVVGGAVLLGVSLVVGKGFRQVRLRVRAKQADRRRLLRSQLAPRLTAGTIDGECLEIDADPRGRCEFTEDEFGLIREEIERLVETTDSTSRHQITARLRRRGFYVSDWTLGSRGFELSDLESLLATGAITVAST